MNYGSSVHSMSELAAKERLIQFLYQLDELDEQGFFGIEGWRYHFHKAFTEQF